MKRAVKINLSGRIFHIDEDAYEKLKNYLDTISGHFSNVEESNEILDDIEARIAELLIEKLRDENQVVTLEIVRGIIEVMGQPEEIVDEETTNGGTSSRSESYQEGYRSNRRLYRDPDNAVFGGVASGLGAYFNIDILLLRILFVVLILVGWGFPLILYLILWIAVPKAKTAAEKLEMKGEEVNVSNLEKKIREEYEGVKENLKKARNSKAGRQTENFFEEFFRVIGKLIVIFLKVILAFVALGFVIAGISLIASIIGVAFIGAGAWDWGFFNDNEFPRIIAPFINPVNVSFIAIAGILLILIPVLAIIYGIFKALFRFKARDRALGMAAFTLWIISLFAVITLGFFEARDYTNREDTSMFLELDDISSDTLYLRLNDQEIELTEDLEDFQLDDTWYRIGEDGNIYGAIEIDIFRNSEDFYTLEVEKASQGPSYQKALEYAENINYEFNRKDSLILFNPFFLAESEEKWRFQEVDINIGIPEGKAVVFDRKLLRYIDRIQRNTGTSKWQMADKAYIMTEKGLEEAK